MEWNKQQPRPQLESLNGGGNNGGMFSNVMTDEQMEVLRKQIAAYATICDQLEELHRSLTFHDDLAGSRLGNPYTNPLMAPAGHKLTRRQRWNPTPGQIQILEGIFDEGNQNPNKDKVTEITAELAKHGQITESNVYNWFQNRRARLKKKQLVAEANNPEPEVEIVRTTSMTMQSQEEHVSVSTNKDFCNQNPEAANLMLQVHAPEASSLHPGSYGQITNYKRMPPKSKMEQMIENLGRARDL